MKKSYYNQKIFEQMLNDLRKSGKCQAWFTDALKILEDNIEYIPVEEDENRFVVEFIYPH